MRHSKIQGDRGIAERRSPRVLARIPVGLTASQGSAVSAFTAVISRHGALILSEMLYDEGTILTIQNEVTSNTAGCRVVWVGDPDPSGAHKLGIEFIVEAPRFWGRVYDDTLNGSLGTSPF